MKKLIWWVVAAFLVVWSILAWLIHGLVGWGGGLAASNADIVPDPQAVEFLSWLALLGTSLGEWLVVAVWAVGAIAALVLGFAGNRILPRLRGLVPARMGER